MFSILFCQVATMSGVCGHGLFKLEMVETDSVPPKVATIIYEWPQYLRPLYPKSTVLFISHQHENVVFMLLMHY